jgi:hypothetical protein
MDSPFTNPEKITVLLALVGALAAVTAAPALADPPNYPRHLAQTQAGLTHEPEIVSGIVSPVASRQPVRVPEIVSGITSPASTAQPVSAVKPDVRGFNWGSAAIGAAGAFAIIVLVGGTTFVVLRHRRRAMPEVASSPLAQS